jgi:hypothetical protein
VSWVADDYSALRQVASSGEPGWSRDTEVLSSSVTPWLFA